MQFLDDLWSTLTAALYEYRVPLVLLAAAGIVLFAIVACRRAWFAAARRHPGRSTLLAAAVLVIALPITWYLASPLIIRTELVEPAPVAAIDATSAPTPSRTPAAPSPAAPSTTPTATASPSPVPTPTPFLPTEVALGKFHGSDDFHFGRGTATVIEIEPGRYHLRLEDFSVRNGPDLYVYLSPSADGYAKGAVELGTLKATDGSFGYDLPAGTDPSDFASAVIWCKQFRHLFATAPFEQG